MRIQSLNVDGEKPQCKEDLERERGEKKKMGASEGGWRAHLGGGFRRVLKK